MKGLKLFISAIAALALLAAPAAVLAKSHRHHRGVSTARFHRWERHFHLGTGARVARQDPDHDGLSNIAEFRDHANPVKADTDGDGVGDKQEIEDNTNPNDAEDNDADEVSGTVASFDGTTLVIQLPNNTGTVSGTVNQFTEVDCENEDADTTAHMSEDGGSGDNSGPGSDDQGENENEDENDDAQENQDCAIAVNDFVHEAEFVTDTSGNTFTKVELNK